MSRRFRNLPYGVKYDDWDNEWANTLPGKVGFVGRSVQSQLDGLGKGDTLEVLSYPVIPALRGGTFRVVSKAWLKIITKEAGADATANATWTSAGGLQSITTTNVAGIGQILNAATPELRFDLTRANTNFLAGNQSYFFAVQVLMDDGAIYEIEKGSFHLKPGIITATS